MKVAVSIPDAVFSEAEALAKRLNKAQLVERAGHVERRQLDRVLTGINIVLGR